MSNEETQFASQSVFAHHLPGLSPSDVIPPIKKIILDAINERSHFDGPPDFHHITINSTLEEIGIGRQQDEFLFNKWKHLFSPEAITAPYKTDDGRTRLEVFVDRVLELVADNPILMGTLMRLNLAYPSSDWQQLMQDSLVESDDVFVTDLSELIHRSVHQAVVYDGLVREMYRDPASFLFDVEKSLQVKFEGADLSGGGIFFNIKFPSVRKPIKEFINTSRKTKEEDFFAAKKSWDKFEDNWNLRSSPENKLKTKGKTSSPDVPFGFQSTTEYEEKKQEELEALEGAQEERRRRLKKRGAQIGKSPMFRRDRYQRMQVAVASSMVDEDPTSALRTNIKEATYAELYLWKDSTVEYTGRNHGDVPPNCVAGAVIASDRYFGSTRGCDAECYETFGAGKYLFTDSRAWAYLYHAWNVGFTVTTGTVGLFWAKLFVPAVMEDGSGESYIIRRTLALWLALSRIANKRSQLNFLNVNKKRSEHEVKREAGMQLLKRLGDESFEFARFYQTLWQPGGSEECQSSEGCPDAVNLFENTLSSIGSVKKVLKAISMVPFFW
uniref:Uncharacterized protein n=1 Tax=Chromera velia CCMP2878 TaxID=1169474 RepID=A0A0G4GZ82_9ALVE|eukprot:Cvel_24018.t1-p1 / transcript=Cvel_24018.t1 / gene=Cvel_24018 / organism=Chromera_velia_CCMP2878 / gene_product=hypothetical protein / transcript_product=hypothetical protein / location=Cvel_scaffold2548:8196-14144(+) / protein_length=553 / sequence_SO=supercontig / SO=protein_coding / is_pseudo=false